MAWLDFTCRHRYPGGFQLDVAIRADRLVTSLFGPSGSGKTSILEMIAGLRAPQQGKIEVAGRTVFDSARRIDLAAHRRHIGLAFQDHLLFPHLTVEGNLHFGYRRRAKNGRAIAPERVVQVLDLAPLLKRHPASLSGGERQRVALGRAILSNPAALLMDEPLAALDERLKTRILAYLERALDQWQIPTLLVSHGQAEVRRIAQWVVVLDRGRVLDEGIPEEALGKPDALARTDAAAVVNLLRLERLALDDGGWTGNIGQQQLWLPPQTSPPATPAYVQFSPGSVLLSPVDVGLTSARNHLRGTVRQVVRLPTGCFVAVDVGQIVWAQLTPAAVAELKLAPGSEVFCLIKTHSLSVVD